MAGAGRRTPRAPSCAPTSTTCRRASGSATGARCPASSRSSTRSRAAPTSISLLLTGNTAAGAKAKLEHYGLARYFAGGAFCVDGDDRPSIARRALTVAAERVGGPIDPASTFVIGDTPHDVRCGKEIGARTVAVASGTYALDELEREDPWLALAGLPEPAEFAELLMLDR